MAIRFATPATILILAYGLVAPPSRVAAEGPPFILMDHGPPRPVDPSPQAAAGVCVLEPAPRASASYHPSGNDTYGLPRPRSQ